MWMDGDLPHWLHLSRQFSVIRDAQRPWFSVQDDGLHTHQQTPVLFQFWGPCESVTAPTRTSHQVLQHAFHYFQLTSRHIQSHWMQGRGRVDSTDRWHQQFIRTWTAPCPASSCWRISCRYADQVEMPANFAAVLVWNKVRSAQKQHGSVIYCFISITSTSEHIYLWNISQGSHINVDVRHSVWAVTTQDDIIVEDNE